jgi:hypothetical protein
MRSRPVLATVALVAVSPLPVGHVLPPASAAPPKGFSTTTTFVDDSPDPSAYFLGPEHCLGQLPREEPVPVTLPAAGSLKISIEGFTGEWSLLVMGPKGEVLATADADAPATEELTMRVRKAGRVDILPCNLAGTFEAKLSYTYTPKK